MYAADSPIASSESHDLVGPETAASSFDTVARVIRVLRKHAVSQPRLEQLAKEAGLSASHLQRVFSDWAGVSPKRFLQYLTAEYAVQCLRQSARVPEAALMCGLSSPGRLHDLVVCYEAMTPAKVRVQGDGVEVWQGTGQTPFGAAVVGWTRRGICFLEFETEESPRERLTEQLRNRWSQATHLENAERAQELLTRVFQKSAPGRPLHVHVQGTNFQLKVWGALMGTQRGEQLSYRSLPSGS